MRESVLLSALVSGEVPPLMRCCRSSGDFCWSAFIHFSPFPGYLHAPKSRLLVFLGSLLCVWCVRASSPQPPFTAAKTDCLKEDREGRGEEEEEGGRERGREGIIIRFGPYHRDNRARAGAYCLRATPRKMRPIGISAYHFPVMLHADLIARALWRCVIPAGFDPHGHFLSPCDWE